MAYIKEKKSKSLKIKPFLRNQSRTEKKGKVAAEPENPSFQIPCFSANPQPSSHLCMNSCAQMAYTLYSPKFVLFSPILVVSICDVVKMTNQ